jgi:hypothetical protein
MESGHDVAGDVLQVIPRRPPSARPPEGGGTGSYRFVLPPERRKKLTRIVLGTLAACALILVAAGIVHLVRPSNDASDVATTATAAPAVPSPNAAPAAPPAVAAATPDAPQTGTLRLQKPLVAGKVWLDGQKMTAASATIACGTHQLKIGAHGRPRSIDVPCGGELKLSR